MADNESFSADISSLWGDNDQDALEPPPLNGTVTDGHEPSPAPTNGSYAEVMADDPGDHVGRLANALAGHQVDVVRRAELGAVRAEMEDAFTQKLAVALYELLAVSQERFSSVEGHMDRRLQDVVAELNDCIRSQSDRLAATIDAQQRAEADLARSAREELMQFSDRFASSEMRDAAATESLEKITERMASVQSDLAEVHEAIQALREEVSNLRPRPAAWRRWGRSG